MHRPSVYFEEKNVIRTLIAIAAILVIALMTTLYLVAGLEHIIMYPSLYISSTYVRDPTRAVAAYILPLLAFLFVIVSVSRINRMSPYIFRWQDIWLLAFLILCISMLFMGLCAVGAVPISTQHTVHSVGVILLFVGGTFTVITFTVLDDRLFIIMPDFLRITRIAIAVLTFLVGLTLAITTEMTDITASIAEIVLVSLFALYVLTWAHESDFPIRSAYLPHRLSFLESSPPCHPPV